jgi:hypothetical protein
MDLDANPLVALWLLCPPPLSADPDARKFGKAAVRDEARRVRATGVIRKRSLLTGEFWLVIRAETLPVLSLLRKTLVFVSRPICTNYSSPSPSLTVFLPCFLVFPRPPAEMIGSTR